jgi:hypothetical protein
MKLYILAIAICLQSTIKIYYVENSVFVTIEINVYAPNMIVHRLIKINSEVSQRVGLFT